MGLYRVTFQTEILVDCESEGEAERIGYDNLESEVHNGGSDVYRVEKVESVDQLRRQERGSLPWRDKRRDWNHEVEKRVEEILENK